jgi:SpoVK/Ycf46/Vps4 family AAA+-type ATPase
MNHPEIESLKEALKLSPENVLLRKLLAEAFYKYQFYNEAEQEYREALRYAPNDQNLKLGLATTFYAQAKYNLAQVVIEELLALGNESAGLFMLQAKVFFELKDYKSAFEVYKKAIHIDRTVDEKDFYDKIIEALNDTGVGVNVGAQIYEDPEEVFWGQIEKPAISFKDVGGMENIKQEIDLKIIQPLKNPDIYKAFGKKIGGGILMYGPPGCGKTHLARATAGEINASFIAVGINEVLDMWLGNSEKNLHSLFQTARENTPCVLFFDEVDALGASRSDMRRAEGRFLINQFLDELDGVKYSNDGVLVLGATNSPWYLDPAFRRPGRFDRIIFVQPPDQNARQGILELLLQGKPTEKLDLASIAKNSQDYSGADLKAVVDIAIESKIPESIRQNKILPISTLDLKNALAKHKATTKEWFATAKNYALYSNEGGLYDDVLKYLKIKK